MNPFSYATYRSTIKSGDLLSWSHRGWGSWHDFKVQMVRFFTQSEYSHVGCAWVVGERVFVIEAVEPRARVFPLSKLGDFYHNQMSINWSPDVEEAALETIGEDYKQLNAIKAYFTQLADKDVSECAALYLHIAMTAGIFLGKKATPTAVVQAAQLLGSPTRFIKS